MIQILRSDFPVLVLQTQTPAQGQPQSFKHKGDKSVWPPLPIMELGVGVSKILKQKFLFHLRLHLNH